MLSIILWNLFVRGDQIQNLFGTTKEGNMCVDGNTQVCIETDIVISQALLAKKGEKLW